MGININNPGGTMSAVEIRDSLETLTGDDRLNLDYTKSGTTNKAYTSTEQAKLDGIEDGAEVNPADTDELPEGEENLYYPSADKVKLALMNSSLFLEGLKLEYVSTTQVKINIGKALSDDQSFLLELSSSKTADITASGANGLDAGSEAVSTHYFVWLIYNPSTTTYAALLSTSSTDPTMPADYTKKRRVGVIINDSSGNFLDFEQAGQNNKRQYYIKNPILDCSVISGGSATGSPANVSCAAYVPTTANIFNILFANNDAAYAVYIYSTSDSRIAFFGKESGGSIEVPNTNLENFAYYYTSGGSLFAAVTGFIEDI